MSGTIASRPGSGSVRSADVCTIEMDSTPPATITSIWATMTCLAALAIAMRPEEHCRSIVMPETVMGRPARHAEIGRAECRERVCQYSEKLVVGGYLKN